MDKRKKITITIGILLALILVMGISYAYFKTELFGEKKNLVQVGTLELVLDETSSNGITLTNTVAILDSDGIVSSPFSFSLKNNGNQDLLYTLYFDDEDLASGETRLRDELIKFNLEKNGTLGITQVLSNTGSHPNRILDSGRISGKTTISYNLRVWINSEIDENYSGQSFKAKLRVEVEQAPKEKENAPELASNMIPVVYNGSSWVKADVNNNWYDYNQQKWANAVTVNASSRSTYLSAKVGTAIHMDDINTMWVWIPRYSYTIASMDGTSYYGKKGNYLSSEPTKELPGEIDVKFVSTSTKDRGTAKYVASKGVSNWYTPDGFTFGDQELSGLWYAKFEPSNLQGQYTANSSSLTPIVKPKVTSWRNIQVANLETAGMGMTKANNVYGLSSSEVDTHASKNSEWAVVAYLSQSKYGKLGNKSYSGANKEVYMNNYNGFRTGCSSGLPSAGESTTCTGDYDNLTDRGNGTGSIGGGASTTGNIYGVYDMNGGAWEYVMTNYNNYSGYSSKSYTVEEAKAMGRTDGQAVEVWNSGYSGKTGFDNLTWTGVAWPDPKYYDLYTTNNMSTACNGKPCTGQALNETASWYGDYPHMVNNQSPWLRRGGWSQNGAYTGAFASSPVYGNANWYHSFRLVLTNK